MDISALLHNIALIALPLLFGITLHEAAHCWVAKQCGDRTAWLLGRVSLNPARHIDWFGTVFLPILMLVVSSFTFAFGWAKPVPITWQNLNNPRRDAALVAAAGPLANLVMAIFWACIAKLGLFVTTVSPTIPATWTAQFAYATGLFGINLNVLLMLLNLLPLPPLDGSRILSSLLPPALAAQYARLEPYGIWILLGLFALGGLNRLLLPPVFLVTSLIRQTIGV
ncbi:MAG: peptidase M50 [Gammaproteobacteria bacterium RIFCSPHIGHO2_12_FULL_45_9]|nr:MAG: peptidase M50 [Gammaproteobacteria bacterium RIFCSPHIGHO2_12_FULL_45_9]